MIFVEFVEFVFANFYPHALTICTLKGNASLHSYLGFGYDIPIKLCFVHSSTALFLSPKFILNPKLSLSQSYSIAGNLTMPSHGLWYDKNNLRICDILILSQPPILVILKGVIRRRNQVLSANQAKKLHFSNSSEDTVSFVKVVLSLPFLLKSRK